LPAQRQDDRLPLTPARLPYVRAERFATVRHAAARELHNIYSHATVWRTLLLRSYRLHSTTVKAFPTGAYTGACVCRAWREAFTRLLLDGMSTPALLERREHGLTVAETPYLPPHTPWHFGDNAGMTCETSHAADERRCQLAAVRETPLRRRAALADPTAQPTWTERLVENRTVPRYYMTPFWAPARAAHLHWLHSHGAKHSSMTRTGLHLPALSSCRQRFSLRGPFPFLQPSRGSTARNAPISCALIACLRRLPCAGHSLQHLPMPAAAPAIHAWRSVPLYAGYRSAFSLCLLATSTAYSLVLTLVENTAAASFVFCSNISRGKIFNLTAARTAVEPPHAMGFSTTL